MDFKQIWTKNIKNVPKMGVSPFVSPKEFFQKSGPVSFVPFWCPNFMQKISKKLKTFSEISKDRPRKHQWMDTQGWLHRTLSNKPWSNISLSFHKQKKDLLSYFQKCVIKFGTTYWKLQFCNHPGSVCSAQPCLHLFEGSNFYQFPNCAVWSSV